MVAATSRQLGLCVDLYNSHDSRKSVAGQRSLFTCVLSGVGNLCTAHLLCVHQLTPAYAIVELIWQA